MLMAIALSLVPAAAGRAQDGIRCDQEDTAGTEAAWPGFTAGARAVAALWSGLPAAHSGTWLHKSAPAKDVLGKLVAASRQPNGCSGTRRSALGEHWHSGCQAREQTFAIPRSASVGLSGKHCDAAEERGRPLTKDGWATASAREPDPPQLRDGVCFATKDTTIALPDLHLSRSLASVLLPAGHTIAVLPRGT